MSLHCRFLLICGRTVSSGGHRDNQNKSGLGSYHYHCGGYPAPLHNSDYCPYRDTFPKRVSLTADKTTLRTGETVKIQAKVYPSNACSDSVFWTCSDTAVIQLSNGTLQTVSYGTATIRVTTAYN